MSFSRGKVQILYNYLPGAIFAHDSYGYCRVTGIDLQTDSAINAHAVADAVSDTLQQWHNDWQRAGFPEIRDKLTFERRYVIGVPTYVRFEPFPELLQCQQCLRVYSLPQLRRQQGHEPRKCLADDCNGNLTQLPFTQAHNCGRVEEIFVDRRGCPIHGTAGLYFDDTGRVTTARWRCIYCGGAEVSRLRQTPCSCDYSRLRAQNNSARRMRVFSVTDPAVFRPSVASFVNFSQSRLSELSALEMRSALVGRLWNMIDEPVKGYLENAQRATSQDGPELESLIRDLEELNPDHPKVKEWHQREKNHKARKHDLDKILSLTGAADASSIDISRRMTEHIAILDTLNATTSEMVINQLNNQGEIAAANRMSEAIEFANSWLGIGKILAVQDFPVGLCALGYTRVTKSPDDSIICPFPQVNGRTPIYTVTTTTEAIYLQLDPIRVLNWLKKNNIIAGDIPQNEAQAWSWIYRNSPGLRQSNQQPEFQSPEAVAIRTLLHSMSHILLRNIEWSGYASQSLGEYLLPEGLAFVLFANRYTDTKVGGLLTLFEQELQGWLQSALQEGIDCLFDPFCTESGGSCVGCLHREYNCPVFNQELSRSTLYGGPISHEGQTALPIPDIQFGFWN
ncbi:MAG: hypothetical protein IBX64_10290 [Actinobacteria bacterium]|nr:hypothetical protein [Actinomycetota bacterium]